MFYTPIPRWNGASACIIFCIAIAIASPVMAQANNNNNNEKQETCGQLQNEIQKILLQAVQQRNQQRQSPIRMEQDAQYNHQQRLNDVKQRAKQAGCIKRQKQDGI